MRYTDEDLLALPVSNGWKMTADKFHKRRSMDQKFFVAECVECKYKAAFDSVPMFLNNLRQCRECNKYSLETRALHYHESIYKYNARKFNREWSMSFSEFSDLVRNVCYYCGSQPQQRILKAEWPFAGIDRVDNAKGYVVGNVRPCCRICNVAKNNMTEEEFREKVTAWYERIVK